MRFEADSVLGDVAQIAEAEHLKTAAVRKNCAIPVHETMQAASFADEVRARAHPKMVGVGQDQAGTDGFKFFRRHALDRSLGAHRHEGRCLQRSVGRVQETGTGAALAADMNQLKADRIVVRHA